MPRVHGTNQSLATRLGPPPVEITGFVVFARNGRRIRQRRECNWCASRRFQGLCSPLGDGRPDEAAPRCPHPTNTIGKLVGRAATRSNSDARAAKKHLREWVDSGGVTQSQARAEEIRVGVQGNTERGGIITAEIADDAEPAIGIIGD